MSISPPELPPVPQVIDEQSLPAIEQTWLDQKNRTNVARELTIDYPKYMETAWKVAHDLYPNPEDTAKREAFLHGTELTLLLERHRKAAADITQLMLGNSPEAA